MAFQLHSLGVVLINVVLTSSQSGATSLRFLNDTYTATVGEHASHGTRVLKVQAYFVNVVNGTTVTGSTGTIIYSLAVGDSIFAIDASTGEHWLY